VIDRYSRRWGIENSYKTIKDFLAWTTSKDYTVRLFYFGFAVLLYNMWLLVDLLVQLSFDIEHWYKPRVTAKRFLNLARKLLSEPG
jgi:IS4 transposase